MSNLLTPYPDQLSPVHWEKKKGSLPAGSTLPEALKTLQRKHAAVDWPQYEPGWSKACKTAAELEQSFAQRDRGYRGSAQALKREAADVASSAQKLARDKSSAKPTLEAAKAIAEAAGKLADAVDAGAEALKKEFDKARAGLPAEDAGAEADEPGSVLLDPKNLLKLLNLCKRNPEQRMQFAFTDAHDKQAAVLALHPRMAGRKMFATLQIATKVKTGAFGIAWVAENQLILQLDKPLGGLVKKVRAPLRAASFKVSRVVLWNPDGSVFEQDDDDADDADTVAAPQAAPAQTADAATDEGADPDAVPVVEEKLRAYEDRRAAMWQAIQDALRAGPDERASKLRALLGFADGKSEAGQYEVGLKGLEAVQILLKPALLKAAATAAPQASAVPGRPAMKVSTRIAFMQSRLAWQETRRTLREELARLERAVLDECRNEPDFAEIQANSGVLYSVLDHLDEQLIDKLDDALNAESAEQRAASNLEALKLIEEYIEFAKTDVLLADIAGNSFLDISIPALLDARLSDMANKLRAAA